jgi:hypothetical protein
MKLLTPASIRQAVLARDNFACVAPIEDPAGGQCHDRYGRPGYRVPIVHLELDHVGEGRMGKAAPTEARFLVTLCPGHHRGVGEKAGYVWATCHRPLLRGYLAKRNAGLGVPLRLDLSEDSPTGELPVRKQEAGL